MRRVRRASRLGRAKLSRRGWNRDNKPVLWKRNQRGGGGGVQSYCAGVQETPKKVLIQLQDAIGCREWIAGTSDSCTACIQSALCGFFFYENTITAIGPGRRGRSRKRTGKRRRKEIFKKLDFCYVRESNDLRIGIEARCVIQIYLYRLIFGLRFAQYFSQVFFAILFSHCFSHYHFSQPTNLRRE